jgi:hypothetical protein
LRARALALAGEGCTAPEQSQMGRRYPNPEPLGMSAVPFKANADRRHHIPKQQDRVTNWCEYDAALRQAAALRDVGDLA